MPGHFTHIYAARRVADLLSSGRFEDWPAPPHGQPNPAAHYSPQYCGQIMQKWEKFTAVGAIGPDLFYFSQDYNNAVLGPLSDKLMLAFAAYYFYDAAKEDDWEPLLIILQGINEDVAAILRILIKLQKAWQSFLDAWNATIGPVVNAAGQLLDDITGGVLSQLSVALGELKDAFVQIGEQELLTFKDIFSFFDSCVQKGWPESSFLWSDMSHYRGSSRLSRAFVEEAEALKVGEDGNNRFEQFLAFSMGYMTHLGADTIGHSFINEQVGGPYRNHPQRHHTTENHIDAWHYRNAGAGGTISQDPWGATKDYPDFSMSAMWFAIQMTPDDPAGKQRPSPLPDDPDQRKKALDVDGEMPLWMAQSISNALVKAFKDHPHPLIFRGSDFQDVIDAGVLADAVKIVTGGGLDRPLNELLAAIAPSPTTRVPRGFPLPWQIRTMYRIMYSFYRFSYNGTWELQKPKRPDIIITPPASDFTNLLQPPDFSGVDSSDPLEDICAIFLALIEWVFKELGAAIQLTGDLIKMVVSPATYPLRAGLYELAMMIWDVVMKTHDVLAHTGLVTPHGEQRYEDGELRLPNEIDLPLITLGWSSDKAFQQALADAIDPFGNLDKDPSSLNEFRSVPDNSYPLLPVIRFHKNSAGDVVKPLEAWEYRRPWAYPETSLDTYDGKTNFPRPTEQEHYDPSLPFGIAPAGPYAQVRGGPYKAGTRSDQVFFRTNMPVIREARALYERSRSPADTDLLNRQFIDSYEMRLSPLGDIVPFSCYLIGQLSNQTGYATEYNLDSDRGYGYLTWDWIRGKNQGSTSVGDAYDLPKVPPPGTDAWNLNKVPLQLRYIDAIPNPG